MTLTKKLALCAILSAIGVVVLVLAAVYPPLAPAFAAFAGLFGAVAVIHCGAFWALGVWIICGALGLLLSPAKGAAVLYLLFFGWYPVAKSGIERIGRLPLCWAVKLLTASAPIVGSYFVYYRLFVSAQSFAWYVYLGLFLVMLAVFAAYDFAFSGLISFYLRRIRPHIRFLT